MIRTEHGRRARRFSAAAAGIALLGSLLTIVPAAGQAPPECPEAMPLADLDAGMMGVGLTVSRGTEPEPFDAEILGVFPDAILPGRDLVIAEVHSPAIDEVGGVWFGMSGSPVYVDDGGEQKLVGAVAWGGSFGPSHIIGLTAAEDMLDLLDYPSGLERRTPARIEMTAGMKRTVADATGESVSEVDGSFRQLRLPVSVSGIGAQGAKRLQRKLNNHGYSIKLYPGSSASVAAVADPSEVVAGGNFVAAQSYGDLTFAGVGTTTFVCDGFAVAFGHPFFFEGKTSMGANVGSAITIWEDPVFGPYKLANIGGRIGAVDQDRFAGIRADLGTALDTIPITSRTFAENTGRFENGRTEATVADDTWFLAPYHEYLNVISAMDQYSGGSAELKWTIEGTRADGSPFELSRVNMASSIYDIPWEATHEITHMIEALAFQNLEEIEFTAVDFELVVVREEVRHYRVAKVLVSKEGGRFEKASRVVVRPRMRLDLRVFLNPYEDDAASETVELSLRVPDRVRRGGSLRVFGGPGHHVGIVPRADTFDELLRRMAEDPPLNNIGAELRIGRKVKDRDRALAGQVVNGGKSIDLVVRRAHREGAEG